MPLALTLELQERLKDRYDSLELLELLNLSMDEIIEVFDEQIRMAIDNGDVLGD
jgi:hypothetical protein